jgi:type I restriction enzyme S subunit
LGERTISIVAGRTTSFSESGKYPVFGSTGKIGRTEYPAYSGDRILVARVGANAGKVHRASDVYGVTDNTLIIFPVKKSGN